MCECICEECAAQKSRFRHGLPVEPCKPCYVCGKLQKTHYQSITAGNEKFPLCDQHMDELDKKFNFPVCIEEMLIWLRANKAKGTHSCGN